MPLRRVSLALACVLYALFGILDRWVVPEAVAEIWSIRAATCALLLGVLATTWLDLFRRHSQGLLLVAGGGAGLGIVAMVLVARGEGGFFYYAGLMLVIFFIHGLLRLRFVTSSAAALGLIAAYVAVTLGFKPTPLPILLNNLFFLGTAQVLGMFVSYSLEYSLRKVFWLRRIGAEQRRRLDAEHARKSRELEEARQLQLSILPSALPRHPRLDVAVRMITATEVGGDFYDFRLDEDGVLTVAIGDATGHGAKAGALVTAAKILFGLLASEPGLERILDRASEVLRRAGITRIHMAMGLARLEGERLELAGAGMPPALLFRAETGEVEELSLAGVPLGTALPVRYWQRAVRMGPADVLLLMSDGLPELVDPRGEPLGYERVKAALREAGRLERAEAVAERLEQLSESWAAGRPRQDDATCLILRLRGAPAEG